MNEPSNFDDAIHEYTCPRDEFFFKVGKKVLLKFYKKQQTYFIFPQLQWNSLKLWTLKQSVWTHFKARKVNIVIMMFIHCLDGQNRSQHLSMYKFNFFSNFLMLFYLKGSSWSNKKAWFCCKSFNLSIFRQICCSLVGRQQRRLGSLETIHCRHDGIQLVWHCFCK